MLARHAGILDPDDDTGLRLETMRIAHHRQAGVATEVIHTAAEQIRFEHGLDVHWFVGLAHESQFVPPGRERSFARGLAAGLRGDYELAVALLCPQFEHAVRELFHERGIVTTKLPTSGIQNEFDLNDLLKHPRASEVFGEEGAFDLRVLLVEKAGANLRNDLAHGLLDDGASIGAKVYFWWTCLRLTICGVQPIESGKAPENPSMKSEAEAKDP